MAFFRKIVKSEPPKIQEPPKCTHKFKDFPWYVESTYYPYEKRFKVVVYEPYVCVLCGQRIDKKLYEHSSSGTKKDADTLKEAIEEKYGDKIENRVLIEDEINDLQLVDREYLKFYEMIKTGKFHPIELKLE